MAEACLLPDSWATLQKNTVRYLRMVKTNVIQCNESN